MPAEVKDEESKTFPTLHSDKATRQRIFEYLSRNAHALSERTQPEKVKEAGEASAAVVADPQNFLKNSQAFVKKGNFAEAIMQLNLDKDEAQGIHSQYLTAEEAKAIAPFAYGDKPQDLTMPVYLRDAREQKPEENLESSHWQSWAIMGLNYFSAALKLAETSGKHALLDKQKQKLQEQAAIFLDGVSQQTNDKDARAYLATISAKTIIPFVMAHVKKDDSGNSLSEKEARKLINKSKDFANFEQVPHIIATMTSHSGLKDNVAVTRYILDVDVPIFELTPALKKQYENLDGQPWFKKQTPHIQSLIRQYQPAILAGRIIPTQLIEHIPGLRNAYETRLFDVTVRLEDQLWFKALSSDAQNGIKNCRDMLGPSSSAYKELIRNYDSVNTFTPTKFYQAYHSGNLGHKIFSGSTKNKLRRYGLSLLISSSIFLGTAALVMVLVFFLVPTLMINIGITIALLGSLATFLGTAFISKKFSLSLDENDLALTRLSVEQLQQAVRQEPVKAGQKETDLITFSLVTDTGIYSGDSDVEQQLWKVQGEFHSNTPLNMGRLVLSNNMRGIKKLLQIIGTVLPIGTNNNLLPNVRGEKGRLLRGALQELKDLMNSKLPYSHNRNLQMVAKAQEVAFQFNNYLGYERVACDICCKSGKDRVGIVTIDGKTKAIYKQVTGKSFIFTSKTTNDELKDFQDIVENYIKAGHVQKIAGGGGSLGSEGIKQDTALPKHMASFKDIHQPTATHNKEMPREKYVEERFVSDWEERTKALSSKEGAADIAKVGGGSHAELLQGMRSHVKVSQKHESHRTMWSSPVKQTSRRPEKCSMWGGSAGPWVPEAQVVPPEYCTTRTEYCTTRIFFPGFDG